MENIVIFCCYSMTNMNMHVFHNGRVVRISTIDNSIASIDINNKEFHNRGTAGKGSLQLTFRAMTSDCVSHTDDVIGSCVHTSSA